MTDVCSITKIEGSVVIMSKYMSCKANQSADSGIVDFCITISLLPFLFRDVFIFLTLAQEHNVHIEWVGKAQCQTFLSVKTMLVVIQRSGNDLANRGLIIESQEFHSD